MMAGTAAASSSGIRGGDEFGPALETEGGKFLVYLAALAVGTLDFGFCIKYDLFEIIIAALTMIFKNRHLKTPFFVSI